MYKRLKSWEKKKQDPYIFAVSYENIIENQERNFITRVSSIGEHS